MDDGRVEKRKKKKRERNWVGAKGQGEAPKGVAERTRRKKRGGSSRGLGGGQRAAAGREGSKGGEDEDGGREGGGGMGTMRRYCCKMKAPERVSRGSSSY